MSNRTYLQFKQYKDDEERNGIHKAAFNKMKDYVDDDCFDDWEWRDECIHFDKTLEIYSSELIGNLIKTIQTSFLMKLLIVFIKKWDAS